MPGLGVRPGVLVVQKRNSDKDAENIIAIKTKAKYRSYNDEQNIPPPSFSKTNFHNSKHFHMNNGNCKVDKVALEAIDKISIEISKIFKEISMFEVDIYQGKRVPEKAILSLNEMLMVKLLKLDEIVAEGDAKFKRKEQVKRVQKYHEDLDRLKIKNTNNEIKTTRPIRRPLIYFS